MNFTGKKFFISRRKRVLKKVFVGVTLFVIGICSLTLAAALSQAIFHARWISHPFFVVLITTLSALAAYKPLDHLYGEIFKHILFRKGSYTHIMLMNLAEELETILDLQELSNLVVNTFGELFHLKTAALILRDGQRKDFRIASAFGWNVSDWKRVRLSQEASIIKFIRDSGPHVLVRNIAVHSLAWQDANRLAHDFENLRAHWIIPMYVREDLISFLAFSAGQPDRVFDETDFQFFRKFAYAIAKKVYNALRFQELKRSYGELQDVQSRLMQMAKLEAIEQLASGLAHQIHNPLTIISGKAQVLLLQKDRITMDERVQEVLKTIVKQTKRAADITKKLLMFSQRSEVPKKQLHLDQVLEDTLSLVSYQVSLEDILVTKSVDSHLPSVYANLGEMREVFLNLILNAVESVGSHGKVHVGIQYDSKEHLIEIQVSDTGRGIAPENLDKVFNPFFTTQREALGLGLFVTKQIIQRMGGSIKVESRLNEGSLFTVRLFVDPNQAVPAAVGNRTGEVAPSPLPLS